MVPQNDRSFQSKEFVFDVVDYNAVTIRTRNCDVETLGNWPLLEDV